MIVEYNITTGAISGAHYGRVWNASEWVNYETNNPGKAVISISDEYTTTFQKYIQINDGVGTLHDLTVMDVSVSVSASEFGHYPLLSDNSAYLDFTGVPEGSTITIDASSVGTMDASETFRFTAQDAGLYEIFFSKVAHEGAYFQVLASDNI